MNQDPNPALQFAPNWALNVGEAGRAFVYGGLTLFCLAIVLWAFFGKSSTAGKVATGLFVVGSFGLFGAMAALASLFLNNQFEFGYVFSHGGSDVSTPYKIASVWTAQEGSFLLWGCTSALFGVLSIWGTGLYRRWYGVSYATFLAVICGILAYESPFNIPKEVMVHGKVFLPPNGAGMVPSLQNYWVIIHPPTIFMGFGSLTILFAYSVAAMLSGNAEDWVRRARPWSLVTLAILGLGVCMGGMWAYETQGWGGFWAWDPVENVSFVPWLFTAALAHGLIVQNTKGRWTGPNLFLAAIPFLAFVYGTFLTRSGLLDKVSVHSFASMDKSALLVLRTFMIAVTAAYAVLFAVRGRALAAKESPDPDAHTGLRREGMYRFGVLILSLFASVVALGMSWPVISALRGGQGAAVEERTYHLVVAWFFIPTMIAMAIAPFVSWRAMGRHELWVRTSSVLSIAAGLTGLAMLAMTNPTIGVHLHGGETVTMPFGWRAPLVPWLAVLLFVCMLVAVGNIWRVAEVVSRSKTTTLGGFIAHLGFATLMAGLIISRAFEQKQTELIQPGETVRMLDYLVTYKGLSTTDLEDRNNKALFDVESPDKSHFTARPGLYFYQDGPTEEDSKPQVWPHVEKGLSHDVYFALHPPIVDAWDKPETFKPGETKVISDVSVRYDKFTSEGPLGQVGAKFGALLTVRTQEGEFKVHPTVTLTDQGLVPDMGPVGNDYRIAMLSVSPLDQSVQLRLMFAQPLYPVDLFYKPLTSLVWIGTGILTLGAAMSAFARRRPRSGRDPVPAATEPVRPKGIDPEHAPIPAT